MRKLPEEERVRRHRARKRAYYAVNIVKEREKHRLASAKRRAEKPAETLAYRKAYYKRNPWPYRRCAWRRQGIDPAAAEGKLKAHDGRCDLCRATKPGGGGGWHVDHDHKTLVVRGILCTHCNHALGAVDKVGVVAVENYLRRHGGTVTKTEVSPA